MKHLVDITKIHNAPFVDCITFGSPCQDLSIAGKRAGLAGKRSGLFMEAVRIIKEMRDKSGGIYPTFAVWENVPGAFSSNGGEDFRAVLEELARVKEAGVSIPRPAADKKGRIKWAKAGFIRGDGWSLAWRTFDAQFWGVPQRRRRIALVVDFGGERAGEILFERTGMSRNTEPRIQTWKGIARNPADGAAGHDRVVEGAGAYTLKIRSGCEGGGKGPLVQTEKSATLSTLQDQTLFAAIPINTQIATRHISLGERTGMGWGEDGDPAYTLQAGHEHAVCCVAYPDKARALTARYDGSPCADRGPNIVLCRAHGKANAETLEDCSPTLNCNHEQPIVFESHSQDARYTRQGDTSPACTAQWGTGGNNMPLVAEKALTPWDNQARRVYSEDGSFPALAAREHAGQNQQTVLHKTPLRWIVRRLTPTECERLQGFPDGWTDIGEWVDSKGKHHKPADSPRYKALGNSIALPQWWWLTCKMAQYLPEHATLGSLFDGIGGFPLVWETRHGKGTALWASEIEEFPIAVTKRRFGE